MYRKTGVAFTTWLRRGNGIPQKEIPQEAEQSKTFHKYMEILWKYLLMLPEKPCSLCHACQELKAGLGVTEGRSSLLPRPWSMWPLGVTAGPQKPFCPSALRPSLSLVSMQKPHSPDKKTDEGGVNYARLYPASAGGAPRPTGCPGSAPGASNWRCSSACRSGFIRQNLS